MTSFNGTGLLAVWTDIDAEAEAEFNRWYDTEHVPERVALPGFLSGKRYVAVEGQPKYLALYDLADENVLKSDAYLKITKSPSEWTGRITPHFRNTSRCVYREIFAHGERPPSEANFMLTVRLNTPPEHAKEFNEWYEVDHVPALVAVPGVYCARRYVALEGNPKYLAVYELEEAGVTKSDAWERARNSDWTKRIRPYLRDLHAVTARRLTR
ncbi:MAG: hypothetical protein ACREQX_00945 [Candidatus Binataceae bacterium]